MSRPLVVGIADHAKDAIPVHAAVVATGLDPARLSVLTTDAESIGALAAAESGVRFIHAGEVAVRNIARSGMITTSGGTSVPGISSGPSFMGLSRRYGASDALVDAGIPEGPAEPLGEAIDRGRAVLIYHLTTEEDAAKVEGALREAGLRAVRTHGL